MAVYFLLLFIGAQGIFSKPMIEPMGETANSSYVNKTFLTPSDNLIHEQDEVQSCNIAAIALSIIFFKLSTMLSLYWGKRNKDAHNRLLKDENKDKRSRINV